ncbi:hypothetical protein [Streptomyces sp. NPDC048349]|uniref:hypothetical protein n=1 Tax=Streptomyces sp. NPDC048349 TaxID=3155486 RepID=UPI0034217C77
MEEVVLRLKELLFPAVADIAVLSVDVEMEKVRLDTQCTTAGAACPGCGACSTRVHSSYPRFYALIGQPETLAILERMETVPMLLRGLWEQELETFLDDLEFAWGPHIRLSR